MSGWDELWALRSWEKPHTSSQINSSIRQNNGIKSYQNRNLSQNHDGFYELSNDRAYNKQRYTSNNNTQNNLQSNNDLYVSENHDNFDHGKFIIRRRYSDELPERFQKSLKKGRGSCPHYSNQSRYRKCCPVCIQIRENETSNKVIKNEFSFEKAREEAKEKYQYDNSCCNQKYIKNIFNIIYGTYNDIIEKREGERIIGRNGLYDYLNQMCILSAKQYHNYSEGWKKSVLSNLNFWTTKTVPSRIKHSESIEIQTRYYLLQQDLDKNKERWELQKYNLKQQFDAKLATICQDEKIWKDEKRELTRRESKMSRYDRHYEEKQHDLRENLNNGNFYNSMRHNTKSVHNNYGVVNGSTNNYTIN